MERTCVECGAVFFSKKDFKRYCKLSCQKSSHIRRHKRGPTSGFSKVSSTTMGALSELVVATDLLKKGYAVFRALSSACFCDLIAVRDTEKLFVEVRTGYLNINKRVTFPKNVNNGANIFGIYTREDNEVRYFNVYNLTEVIIKTK